MSRRKIATNCFPLFGKIDSESDVATRWYDDVKRLHSPTLFNSRRWGKQATGKSQVGAGQLAEGVDSCVKRESRGGNLPRPLLP